MNNRNTTSRYPVRKAVLAAAALVAAFTGITPTVRGATLTWDINSGTSGTSGAEAGNGTWANGAGNWWDGTANVNWNNATPDVAIFGHTGLGNADNYTVTLGSDITAASIRKDGGTSGLTIIAPDAD
jgi:hypothetical protein